MQDTPINSYESLMSLQSVRNLSSDEALDRIGLLIDLSSDLKKAEGLQHAIGLSKELESCQLTKPQLTLFHYFLANAWSSVRKILSRTDSTSLSWDQEELEKEVFHFRQALQSDGFGELPKARRCQVLTNLGNAFFSVGRLIEAIEYLDEALNEIPMFGMALGNRGIGLSDYGRMLFDYRQTAYFLEAAHKCLCDVQTDTTVYQRARVLFAKRKEWVERALSSEVLSRKAESQESPLGETKQEVRYRRWCLSKRLFLNPLNDLGPQPIAGIDTLCLPSIVTGIHEGPYYYGFFNQLKQEYVSARYMLFSSTQHETPHFSDRGVLLFNTLDYPSYSLASEEVKTAFRIAYSLFDKIAYFLNHYLKLGHKEREVSFRSLWYTSGDPRKGMGSIIQSRTNWSLRGLFWLSKDLYEAREGFRDSMQPDARELSTIRNHLEHKYLKLHDDLWSGPPMSDDLAPDGMRDTLAYSIYRADFEAKALRLIKMARAGLIYLSLAVHAEEHRRRREKGPDIKLLRTPLDFWEDDWKT